jgi:hypothetical protein
MHNWSNDVVQWKMNGITHLSVPFTWFVKKAIALANKEKGKVIIGGPGAMLMQEMIESRTGKNVQYRSSLEGIEPVTLHNPFATFTTRGCISKCKFCAVPVIEGTFREVSDFVPRPIVCDNNFLAASKVHFNKAVDKLKIMPCVDFNQGLDATIFTPEKADRLAELKIPVLRFSFDGLQKEAAVMDAIKLARSKGFRQISIYVLYGFKYSIDDSVYMAQLMRDAKVRVYPMRYQPLDSLARNAYVDTANGWTANLLSAFQRCFFCTNTPFHEFNNQVAYMDDTEGFFEEI